jgi:hypothetical protein
MNDNVLPSANLPSPGWEDFLIVLGAVVLVALMAFIFAFFRRNQTHLHRHRHHRKTQKKRRRREHRLLNPTLAQTGGLPPIRTKEPPPSQTPP